MDDRTAIPALLRALLVKGTGAPPLTTALELSRVGRPAVNELAALTIDRRLAPVQRLCALLALSIVIATQPDPIDLPSEALDALENNDVVAAALAAGLGAALTSVLAAAGADPSIDATRRLIAHKLVVAGERGPHVAELLFTVGERDRAITLAAEDLAAHLTDSSALAPKTSARLRLLAAHDPEVVTAVLALLPRPLHDRLGALLPTLPGLDPADRGRLRSALVWARSG